MSIYYSFVATIRIACLCEPVGIVLVLLVRMVAGLQLLHSHQGVTTAKPSGVEASFSL